MRLSAYFLSAGGAAGAGGELADERAQPGLRDRRLAHHRLDEAAPCRTRPAVLHDRDRLSERPDGALVPDRAVRLTQPVVRTEGLGQLGLVVAQIGPDPAVERHVD